MFEVDPNKLKTLMKKQNSTNYYWDNMVQMEKTIYHRNTCFIYIRVKIMIFEYL